MICSKKLLQHAQFIKKKTDPDNSQKYILGMLFQLPAKNQNEFTSRRKRSSENSPNYSFKIFNCSQSQTLSF